MKHTLSLGALILTVMLFCSCSPSVTAVITSPDKIQADITCAIPTVLSDMMESLTGSPVHSLISCTEISRNLATHGIPVSSCSLSADAVFSLSTGSMAAGALPFPVNTTASSIAITVSPEALQQLVSVLPEETAASFDLLMAPVLTGELMTSDEYTDLIAVVYGDSIASELKKSQLSLTLKTPAPATLTVTKGADVQTWMAKGRSLTQQFSVSNLLTLQSPVILTISW